MRSRVHRAEGDFTDLTMLEQFESAFTKICGTKCAVGVANGMGAVHSSLAALELNSGDEVVVSPIANPSVILAIIAQDCIPIFGDIDPKTGLITRDEIWKVLTRRTKAIIASHFWGTPCDMDPIIELATESDLVLIEDCSNSVLSFYKGRPVGSLAHAGCFSFETDKDLSMDSGGAVTTNTEGYAMMVRNFAHEFCSVEKEGFGKVYPYPGFDYRVSDIQSSLILSQLKQLPERIERRKHLAQRLDEKLRHIKGLLFPEVYDGSEGACQNYHFRIDRSLFRGSLNDIKDAMAAEGVDGINSASHYYMPEAISFLSEYVARLYKGGYTTRELQLRQNGSFKNDLKHAVRWRIFEPYGRRTIAKLDYADGDKLIHYGPDTCPKAKAYLENTLNWPFSCTYSDRDIDNTAQIINKVLDNYRK